MANREVTLGRGRFRRGASLEDELGSINSSTTRPVQGPLGNTATLRRDRQTKSVDRPATLGSAGNQPQVGRGSVARLGTGVADTGASAQARFRQDLAANPELESGANSTAAINSFNEAFKISRGVREDLRKEQNDVRLNTLAFQTAPTLDNIGSIKAARSLLQEREKATTTLGATPLEQENIVSQIRTRDIDTGLKLKGALGEQRTAQQEETDRVAQAARDATDRRNELETKAAEATGNEDTINEVADKHFRQESFRQNFRSFTGEGFETAFRSGTPERALADQLPALAGLIVRASGEKPPKLDSPQSVLDAILGFSDAIMQSSNPVFRGAVTAAGALAGGAAFAASRNPLFMAGGAILGGLGAGSLTGGSLPNLEIAKEGGGIINVDPEDIVEVEGGSILTRLLNPNDNIARNVVVKLFGERKAEEFYKRLGDDNPFAR